jgi:diguanylate cyclase (GGDEF)-like protein
VSDTEGPGSQRTRAAGRELTSLTERFEALLAVRFGIAVTVLLVAAIAQGQLKIDLNTIAPITVAYMLIGAITEWVRRAASARAINTHHVVLLIDSVYIALVVAPGGPGSQLVFLFYVHLIAVTLLGSHRTGLRIALWDSFLFILIYAFSFNKTMTSVLGTDVRMPKTQEVVLSIVAFWVVALCTAFFSSVNERELRRGKKELRILADMVADIERAREPDEVVEVLLAKSVEAFGFERGAILLNSGERIRAFATGTLAGQDLPEGIQPDAVARQAWKSRTPVLLKELDSATDANPLLAGLLPGAKNVVVVPLTTDGEPLGVLAVERGGPFGIKLPLRTAGRLGQYSAHAALKVRNVRLLTEKERLLTENERLARLDGLTGLANRRDFETALGREVSRSLRTSLPLSLVIFDVDHFKLVNDTLGHQAGDGVLRQIAIALRAGAREVDLVARYGGEEFATLLPACSLEDAVAVVERTRAVMATDPGIGGVTVSAGIATMPDNALTGAELIAAADEALYDAKRAGRDRLSASTRTPSAEGITAG